MQKNIFRNVVMGGCFLALMTGCAKQQDYDALQARLTTQDQQLRQLQPGMADTWSQMQAMRQEIDALKGQMDDLNNAGGARSLVERVGRHDAALRQVETSLALNLNLDAPMPMPVAGVPGSSSGIPVDPSMTGAGGVAGYEDAGGAYGTASGTMTLTPPTPPTASPMPASSAQPDLATALFNTGIQAFNARQYAQAERSFVDFTKNYPQSSQVSSAWYYVGECNFQLNKFSEAALAYDKVITQYPKSSRAAGAYLKQGICFSKLGQKAAAKARLQELIKKYPSSAEAARAKSFLQVNT